MDQLTKLQVRYHAILQQLQGRNLIAVSKGQSVEKIALLYREGQRDFGENYAQELVEKAITCQAEGMEIRWHFLGHLQKNKVKGLLPHLYAIHSLDSWKLAEILSQGSIGLFVFIQVLFESFSGRTGVLHHEVVGLAQKISTLPGLCLQGLMGIAPDYFHAQVFFHKLQQLELQCRPFTQGKLSMGMSRDYLLALPAGATHLRLGEALFGARA